MKAEKTVPSDQILDYFVFSSKLMFSKLLGAYRDDKSWFIVED